VAGMAAPNFSRHGRAPEVHSGIKRPSAGSVAGSVVAMECWRRGRKKIRGDWIKKVECKGHNSLFTFISNTVTDENERKCHFRKKLKFSCQNEVETRPREDART
jgi:hypothetical protein